MWIRKAIALFRKFSIGWLLMKSQGVCLAMDLSGHFTASTSGFVDCTWNSACVVVFGNMAALVHNGLLSVGCQLVPKQYNCEPVQGWKAHDFFVILTLDRVSANSLSIMLTCWHRVGRCHLLIFLEYTSNCQERSYLEIVSWEPVGSNDSMTQPILEAQWSCNGHSVILDSLRHLIAIGSDTSPASESMQTRVFELYRTKIVLKDWSMYRGRHLPFKNNPIVLDL